jgi:hypothetical protein
MIGESRTPAVAEALAEMRQEGEVVLGEITKQAGRRKQTVPAWRLNRPIDAIVAQVVQRRLLSADGAQEEEEDALTAGGKAADLAELAGTEGSRKIVEGR